MFQGVPRPSRPHSPEVGPGGWRFEAREVIAGEYARTLAADILALREDEFRAAFKGSAMKRAKREELKRNASVVCDRADRASHGDARSRCEGDR
ncbi:MAG: hypothetical protein KGL38_12885 [Gemmatimonadota bacterium]|nr:hypothetical protein [Gemmatimonadota bacterium]